MGKKGFTIIELVVVMAILGILLLLAVPSLLGYTEKARFAQIQNDIKAHEQYIAAHLVEVKQEDPGHRTRYYLESISRDFMPRYFLEDYIKPGLYSKEKKFKYNTPELNDYYTKRMYQGDKNLLKKAEDERDSNDYLSLDWSIGDNGEWTEEELETFDNDQREFFYSVLHKTRLAVLKKDLINTQLKGTFYYDFDLKEVFYSEVDPEDIEEWWENWYDTDGDYEGPEHM